jgi:hypothetical protein
MGIEVADLFCLGENVLLSWAKIVDCGDAPLTFLVDQHQNGYYADAAYLAQDNTAALKQLDKAHKVHHPSYLACMSVSATN